MRFIGALTLSAFALLLTGCGDSTPPVSKTAIEKSIREVETTMQKAMAAKDVVAFSANYTSDAVLMSPGTAVMRGTAEIQAGVAAMTSDPNLKLEFSADRVEVSGSGDMAASRGSYTLAATDPTTKKVINDKGSYVTVFRKQKDGAWKAVFDIDTSEVPPPAPPAPKSATKKAKRGKKH